jgi:hypothetical protein
MDFQRTKRPGAARAGCDPVAPQKEHYIICVKLTPFERALRGKIQRRVRKGTQRSARRRGEWDITQSTRRVGRQRANSEVGPYKCLERTRRC